MTSATLWENNLRYVDTHCHVDLYPDPAAIMREAGQESVGIVAVTNTPSVFEPMVRLAAGFKNVAVALGLHPELAAERGVEVRLIPGLIGGTRYIGEIGLDGTRGSPPATGSQQSVLRSIIAEVTAHGPTVMTVHSRRAARETLDALKDVRGSVVLHWFTGRQSQAREAVARGWWFSVNAAMLESARGRALVASIPSQVVLTETDGPFAKVDERQSRPVDVKRAVDGLAAIWSVDHEAARSRVMSNFWRCAAFE